MLTVSGPARLHDPAIRVVGQLHPSSSRRAKFHNPKLRIPRTIAPDRNAPSIGREHRVAIAHLAAAQFFLGSRDADASRCQRHASEIQRLLNGRDQETPAIGCQREFVESSVLKPMVIVRPTLKPVELSSISAASIRVSLVPDWIA